MTNPPSLQVIAQLRKENKPFTQKIIEVVIIDEGKFTA